MRWSTIKLIFGREVKDQLRDRRTIFMIFVLPMILYPAIGFGLLQLTLQFGKENRTIGVVGAENLPTKPALLDQEQTHFHKDLFHAEGNQKYYNVVVDSSYTQKDVAGGKIDVLIVIPAKTKSTLDEGKKLRLPIFRNGTNDKSEAAYKVVLTIIDRWGEKILDDRMGKVGKTPDYAHPVEVNEERSDVTSAQERSGSLWGRVIPFLLVMMSLTGAFYPAIDVCAGEKERGTMETLLITPADRREIVAGKFLTVFLFSTVSAMANLGSMGLTFGQVANMMPADLQGVAEHLAPPSLFAIFWMFVLMLPLAGMFSALCMALAVYARSSKEGQYYLMPMFLITTPLVFITLAPGIELNFFYSLVPVTNVALLLRALMMHRMELAMSYFPAVILPTAIYGMMALKFAVRQFHREQVLFREAERFDLVLWVKQLLREKEYVPTAPMAWTCFILMLCLQWYLQGQLKGDSIWMATVAQVVVNLFLPILMALMLTSRPLQTLSLNLPRWLPSVLAIALAFAIHPVALAFSGAVQLKLPVPEKVAVILQQMVAHLSLQEMLIFLAIIPAICEEVAFRGYILTGLRRGNSNWMAIVISSLLFGVYHMIAPQMISASVLGMVLGLIVTRTNSLLPGIVFHCIHNSLVMIRHDSMKDLLAKNPTADTGYSLPIIVISALSSAILIGLLISIKPAERPGNELDAGEFE